ncbi:MAG: Kelch repeat-containing protein [Myxococcota bacterium]
MPPLNKYGRTLVEGVHDGSEFGRIEPMVMFSLIESVGMRKCFLLVSLICLSMACSAPSESNNGGARDDVGQQGEDAFTSDTGGDSDQSTSPGVVSIEVRDIAGPSARSGPAMARDPSNNRMYLYGGYSDEKLDDVWEWKDGAWVELESTLPAESHHGFLYMDEHQQFGVFGNSDETGWLLWDGTEATELSTPCNNGCPLGRVGHAMAYHPGMSAAVLFSGIGGVSNSVGDFLREDTWVLRGTQWSSPPGDAHPSARRDAAMAYDPKNDVIWLFGGQAEDRRQRNDLWMFDESGWTQVQDHEFVLDDFENSARPAPRSGATLTWHPGLQEMVLIGGFNRMVSSNQGRYLGYWTWDGQRWNRLENGKNASPDHPETEYRTWRHNHAALYDPELDAIVVFGGRDAAGNTLLLKIE